MQQDIDQILAIEARRTQALLDADIATLDEITAEDYTHVETGGGARDKAGFLGAMSRPGVRFVRWDIEDSAVRVYGDTAVVTGRYQNVVCTPHGEQPPKNARFTRVYVRRNGRWQNVAHQATGVTSS